MPKVEFDLDKFIKRLERQNVIEFSDVDLLVVLLTEALARERRLREAARAAVEHWRSEHRGCLVDDPELDLLIDELARAALADEEQPG